MLDTPICPVCGEETSYIFVDKEKNVLGCDFCVDRELAYDWWMNEKLDREYLHGDDEFEIKREKKYGI